MKYEIDTQGEKEDNEKGFGMCCDGCICDDGEFNYCDLLQNSMNVDCEAEAVIFIINEKNNERV